MRLQITTFLIITLLTACDPNTLAQRQNAATTPTTALNGQEPAPPPETFLGDHKTCIDRGGRRGEPGDPATERYFQCRAQLLKERNAATPPATDAAPQEVKAAQEEQKVMAIYQDKAKDAHQVQVQTQEEAREQWEREAANKVAQFEAQDNQACRQKGYFVGKPEDPHTEAYFDCRAKLAMGHIGIAPPAAQYPINQVPKAVQPFHEQANKAKQAFNARDYQDHYDCVHRGYLPGPIGPQAIGYYQCRSILAKSGLGEIVAEIFQEDADRAKRETAESAPCMSRGFAYGSPGYKLCNDTINRYKTCKNNMAAQIQARLERDKRDCNEKAALEFPTNLSRPVVQQVLQVSTSGDKTYTTTATPPRYSSADIATSRGKSASICINERHDDREQYRVQANYECERIMENFPVAQQR